jgi:hypothetical protein
VHKEPKGCVLSSSYIVLGQSFVAVLYGIPQQPSKLQQTLQSQPTQVDRSETQPSTQLNAQKPGQSVQAPSVNSSSLDMFKVETIVGFSYEHNFQIFPASQMTN